jgi:hypothetical protein
MLKKIKGALVAVPAVVMSGAAMAQTGIDTTEVTAAITDVQTKGLAIASAVTVCLFLFFGWKLLRRAK